MERRSLVDSRCSPGDERRSPGDSRRSPSDSRRSPGDERRSPSAAMRARAERNLRRARALRAARAAPAAPAAPDTGGGFLPEPEPEEARAPARAPAPRLDPAERPPCLHCARPIALSHLLDTFGHAVCDDCREPDGEHSLVTRTEAKSEFLLRDCDLDARSPPLACVRRRNPHSARGDMRLYLRAQCLARAHLVWGGPAALQAERARRAAERAARDARRGARRLRALRMDVRSSLFSERAAASGGGAHRHEFGAETYDAAADLYSRACACGHEETYEKM